MRMQQPLPLPVKDPVAEAAERAKKEAEAQRLADVRCSSPPEPAQIATHDQKARLLSVYERWHVYQDQARLCTCEGQGVWHILVERKRLSAEIYSFCLLADPEADQCAEAGNSLTDRLKRRSWKIC